MTITLAAVAYPNRFMGGLTGKLFTSSLSFHPGGLCSDLWLYRTYADADDVFKAAQQAGIDGKLVTKLMLLLLV